MHDGTLNVRTMYFSRRAVWNRLEGRLIVHDSFSQFAPRVITMEPWPEVVFMAADGQRTVDEFVDEMATEYEDGEPVALRDQVYRLVETLAEEQLIRLHDQSERLPPYFEEPFFDRDSEVRKEQMRTDGIIK